MLRFQHPRMFVQIFHFVPELLEIYHYLFKKKKREGRREGEGEGEKKGLKWKQEEKR